MECLIFEVFRIDNLQLIYKFNRLTCLLLYDFTSTCICCCMRFRMCLQLYVFAAMCVWCYVCLVLYVFTVTCVCYCIRCHVCLQLYVFAAMCVWCYVCLVLYVFTVTCVCYCIRCHVCLQLYAFAAICVCSYMCLAPYLFVVNLTRLLRDYCSYAQCTVCSYCRCNADVGRKTGRQSISLGDGCLHKSVVVHEIGHVIGFWHEQNRPDRDDYVTVYSNNILDGNDFVFQVNQLLDHKIGIPICYTAASLVNASLGFLV